MGRFNDEYYDDLIELIDKNFLSIFFTIEMELTKNNNEYQSIVGEICKVKNDFPVLLKLVEGDDDMAALSLEDNKALSLYLHLISERELLQAKEIYYRGYKDNYAYLKKLEVI